MRCSRGVLLLVVVALIGVAPSAPASSSDGSTALSSDVPALAGSCSSLLYPPYNSAVNYCGPEWLQEAGYGFVVPRDPVPGVDFSPACYQHDACYSECCQNGMSQAACDDQFEENMTGICADTRDALLDECPWYAYVGCAVAAGVQYVACLPMAGTYRTAVSTLGDGVIEPAALGVAITPIVGPVSAGVIALAVYVIAGEIEIEAAYPCPCACLTCPADEPLGAPSCAVTASGAVVTQNVTHYHKTEPDNVSGLGPVCECVSGEEVTTTPCPPGSTCAPNGRVCTTDICDPATCDQEELVGHCEGFIDFSLFGVNIELFSRLVYEWAVSACRAVDEYRSECATTTEVLESIRCPEGCAADGVSCAVPQVSSLRLRVLEPTARDSGTYVPCAACHVQLEGPAGTFEGTSAIDGTVTFDGVPQGVYLARYGCGPDTLGPHLPSDLILHPSVAPPVSWVFAREPHMTQAPLATVVAPVDRVVDILTGSCGPAPVCSADEMSPTPTAQNLPQAVAATRQQVIEAAVACDYEALAALAGTGSSTFAYSLDETGNPAGHWQSLEQSGTGQPLRWMVTTLSLPVVPAGVGGTEDAYYLWSDGPGGVTSYRTGISATGEWLFFLPDD